jgi:hypothetical protein
MRGKWDQFSVEQDLPFVDETNRIINNPDSVIRMNEGSSFKTRLRRGLERRGWKLNRRATFKANFPFGNTYLFLIPLASLMQTSTTDSI